MREDSPPPLSIPHRVLSVGAHPDDAEFGAGATLARWASGGAEITILVVTDGSKGSWDPDEDTNALVRRRETEQRAAAAVLGVEHCIHLGYIDGELEYSMELRTEIARAIRRVRPDVVLTHDPWKKYEIHPDHRATGLAAVDAVVTAREPLAMKGSEYSPHRPAFLLLWSPETPDHAEPIAHKEESTKIESLLCHSSQGATTMGNPESGPSQRTAFERFLEDLHRSNGEQFGLGSAEVFKKMKP